MYLNLYPVSCKRISYKIYFFLLSIIFLFSANLYAQKHTGIIEGKIIDNDGNPAVDVSVVLKKLNKTSITGNNGAFIFQHLPALKDTLIISSVDSKPLFHEVTLNKNEVINIGIIKLEYNIQQLQSVEIYGRKQRSYKSDYSIFGNKTETPSINIPQSISTITKELISDKMEFTLKDAVDEVAGVNQYSGYDEYTIRGFRAENARDING
ncbi:MAG: carboxypeptidase-like regulatory domain-containing protein, partial [Ginsengibacter sp.]